MINQLTAMKPNEANIIVIASNLFKDCSEMFLLDRQPVILFHCLRQNATNFSKLCVSVCDSTTVG